MAVVPSEEDEEVEAEDDEDEVEVAAEVEIGKDGPPSGVVGNWVVVNLSMQAIPFLWG